MKIRTGQVRLSELAEHIRAKNPDEAAFPNAARADKEAFLAQLDRYAGEDVGSVLASVEQDIEAHKRRSTRWDVLSAAAITTAIGVGFALGGPASVLVFMGGLLGLAVGKSRANDAREAEQDAERFRDRLDDAAAGAGLDGASEDAPQDEDPPFRPGARLTFVAEAPHDTKLRYTEDARVAAARRNGKVAQTGWGAVDALATSTGQNEDARLNPLIADLVV